MSRSVPIEPDLNFIRELKAHGAADLKKCFQCASCSVVCGLSAEKSPFPRKEMLWAQWGLKDRLLKDPDIWLCHQCNDCSKHCPRGAHPGEVLAGVRRVAILENAFPQVIGRMMNRPLFLPLFLAVAAFLLAVSMNLSGTLEIPEGPVIFRNLIPYAAIDAIFLLTSLWAVLSSAVGIRRVWRGFRSSGPTSPAGPPGAKVTAHILPAIGDILKHIRFKDCLVEKGRYYAHLNILWGFILLTITTVGVASGIYLYGRLTPLSLADPMKWLGNFGGLILLLGCCLAMVRRLSKKSFPVRGSYFDWLFLTVVLSAVLSGFLAEAFRLAALSYPAYSLYFIHLILVWFLFASLPYSKFAHFLYRTVAMIYARAEERKLKISMLPPG